MYVGCEMQKNPDPIPAILFSVLGTAVSGQLRKSRLFIFNKGSGGRWGGGGVKLRGHVYKKSSFCPFPEINMYPREPIIKQTLNGSTFKLKSIDSINSLRFYETNLRLFNKVTHSVILLLLNNKKSRSTMLVQYMRSISSFIIDKTYI